MWENIERKIIIENVGEVNMHRNTKFVIYEQNEIQLPNWGQGQYSIIISLEQHKIYVITIKDNYKVRAHIHMIP